MKLALYKTLTHDRAYANKYHPAPTPNRQTQATAPLPTEATP